MMTEFLRELPLNIWAVAITLFLFGLTIFVHELGHFLVARWCGLVVDAFSIGFGPSLWERKIGGVVYKIGILPLGGYVALPQLDPSGGNPHKEEAAGERRLPRVGPFKKILVSLAGVTCNMILAVFLAHVVFWGGKSFAPDKTNIVGYVDTNSTACADGFRAGDEILQVNDRPVRAWEDFIMSVTLAESSTVVVLRATGERATLMPETASLMGGRYVPGIAAINYCMILRVTPGTSAEAAGLQPQDTITWFDGLRVYSREHLSQLVATRLDKSCSARILRKGAEFETTLTPGFDEKYGRPRIGVEFNLIDVTEPMTQIRTHTTLIFSFLKALVTPRHAGHAAKQVGGPVKIFEVLWWSVKASFILALWFTVMLNVNLAIMNLLPIPVLDGGHIVFALWELITGKAVSPRLVNILWNGFAALLLATMLFLSFRDVRDLFSRGRKAEPATNGPAITETNQPVAAPAP